MDWQQEQVIYQQQLANLQEEQEFIAVRNSGAKLSKDGDQWCWLLGEDIMTGCCGLGDTPKDAMREFNKIFNYGDINND